VTDTKNETARLRAGLINVTYVLSPKTRITDESIGLCHLASYLREINFPVKLFQFHTRQDTDLLAEEVLAFKPDVVGFQPFIDTIETIIELSLELKKREKDITIILGGHFATFNSREILAEGPFDFIIKGEGEEALVDVMSAVQAKTAIQNLPGLIYTDKGKVVETPDRPAISDLDTLPFPARDYLEKQSTPDRQITARIITSRGCLRHCSYCSVSTFYKKLGQKRWRGRTVENIVDEIEQLHNVYGVTFFNINDSSFEDPDPYQKERLKKFCREIIKRGLEISLKVNFRPESFTERDRDTIKLLKHAGVDIVFLGAESGSSVELKRFRRSPDVEKIIESIRLFEAENIFIIIGFIMFTPYTTFEDLFENLKFLKRAGKRYSSLYYSNRVIAYKGTHIYDRISQDRLFLPNASYKEKFNYRFVDSRIERIHTFVDNLMGDAAIRRNRVLLYDLENIYARSLNKLNKGAHEYFDFTALKNRLMEIEDAIGNIYHDTIMNRIKRIENEPDADLHHDQAAKDILPVIEKHTRLLKILLEALIRTLNHKGYSMHNLYLQTWDEF